MARVRPLVFILTFINLLFAFIAFALYFLLQNLVKAGMISQHKVHYICLVLMFHLCRDVPHQHSYVYVYYV